MRCAKIPRKEHNLCQLFPLETAALQIADEFFKSAKDFSYKADRKFTLADFIILFLH